MLRLPPLDPRIPVWDGALDVRPCPICASIGELWVERPDGLAVRQCNCGCAFVSPAPTPDALNAFYSSYSSHASAAAWQPEDLGHPLSDPRTAVVAALAEGSRGRRLLDVGFGDGADLLRFRRLGFEVSGADLDPAAVQRATSELGVDARVGGPEAFLGERFDVVLLHDVLEHPLDPRSLLRSCGAVLAGGAILSIWTPNGGAIPADPDRVALRVDLEHMQYLSVANVHAISAQLGFEVEHLETLGHPAVQDLVALSLRSRVNRRVATALPPFVSRALRRRRHRTGSYHLFAVLRGP